jgi:hypothetical protein
MGARCPSKHSDADEIVHHDEVLDSHAPVLAEIPKEAGGDRMKPMSVLNATIGHTGDAMFVAGAYSSESTTRCEP